MTTAPDYSCLPQYTGTQEGDREEVEDEEEEEEEEEEEDVVVGADDGEGVVYDEEEDDTSQPPFNLSTRVVDKVVGRGAGGVAAASGRRTEVYYDADPSGGGEDGRRSGRSCTIMTTETEVANGFVKDGSSLPYIFETNESGNRKRSSKILPVCGMCGKKFVCVTTMKRHLVTHTGEKPFNCKVCGKQYTQKGNLRVHERTHRNDRPFECTICSQKFYRKEPMQKHQWRQHGITHIKGKPSNMVHANNNIITTANNTTTNNNNSNFHEQENLIAAENNSSSAARQGGQFTSPQQPQQHRHQVRQEERPTGRPLDSPHFPPTAQVAMVDVGSDQQATQCFDLVDCVPEPETTVAVETTTDDHTQDSVSTAVTNFLNVTREPVEEVAVGKQRRQETAELGRDVGDEEEEEELIHKPIKLKMKLAQAYMREVKESRDREERSNREREGRGDWDQGNRVEWTEEFGSTGPQSTSTHLLNSLDHNLSEFRLSSSDGATTTMAGTPPSYHQDSYTSSPCTSRPESRMPTDPGPDPIPNNTTNTTSSTPAPAAGENVECQCKSCGTTCIVADPYSFRCTTCNIKHTSLPTHLIADPLQCIGCMVVFAHKPALKVHQSSEDRERPFRCCKCGFEFRQKAHLQKHQWRIHRKKAEPEARSGHNSGAAPTETDQLHQTADSGVPALGPLGTTVDEIINISVAELAAASEDTRHHHHHNSTSLPSHHLNSSTLMVTNNNNSSGSEGKPLDLSPTKMYGTAGSITKWVEQVETARTPIVPHITILKKPVSQSEAASSSSPPSSAMTMFKELLSRPVSPTLPAVEATDLLERKLLSSLTPSTEPRLSSVTIQLLEKKGSGGQAAASTSSWPPPPLHQTYAVKSRPPPQSSTTTSHTADTSRRNVKADNPLLNQVLSFTPAVVNPPLADGNHHHQIMRANKRARTDPKVDLTAESDDSLSRSLSQIISKQQQQQQQQQRGSPLTTGGGILYKDQTQSQPADLSIRGRPNASVFPSSSSSSPTTTYLSAVREAFTSAPGSSDSRSASYSPGPLSLVTTPLRLETPYSTVSPPLNLSHSPQSSAFDYRTGGKAEHILGELHRLKSQDQRSGI